MNIEPHSRAYLAMRAAKRDLEDQVKKLEADMESLAEVMLAELKLQQATSINNDIASVQYVKRTRYYSSEMPALRAWVAATPGAVDLFEGRLHQGNLESWLTDHPELVPPGLQADVKESVKVVAK